MAKVLVRVLIILFIFVLVFNAPYFPLTDHSELNSSADDPIPPGTVSDPEWQKTTNYYVSPTMGSGLDDDDPYWLWTTVDNSATWDGPNLRYDEQGPILPTYYPDMWAKWYEYGQYTQYWFRTTLHLDTVDNVSSIKLRDKYYPDRICLNDNMYVYVNDVYTGVYRGTSYGGGSNDINLGTQWYFSPVNVPISYFVVGDNEVAILAEEWASKGGLGHLVFEPMVPPVADAGPDQVVFEGDQVIFNGTGSYDLDGTIVSYTWNFDDGYFDWFEFVIHRYLDPGIYNVTLTVMDNNGLTDTDTCVIIVLKLPPPPNLHINVSSDGKNVTLNWEPPPIKGMKYYLIYRSISQTDFDFNNVWVNTSEDMEFGESSPIPLRTIWNDTNAADPTNIGNYEEEYYYTIRAVNILGMRSKTSRTVGKWTNQFGQGTSAFSLPLEPIDLLDIENLTTMMNADHIRYMNDTTRTWMKHNSGDGAVNNTRMKLGEGYEVKFENQSTFTFTGMPGAMISYDDDEGFTGFDFSREAKNLSVSILPSGDVNLTWPEPASMNDGWYEIYCSNTRDGFFKTLDVDYYRMGPPVDFDTNTAIHFGAFARDPGKRLYYMVVPFNASGVRGSSTYSIGIWTESYGQGYDTFGLPLKLNATYTVDWYCNAIEDTWGMNYYNVPEQRWMWHKTLMPEGIYDEDVEMVEGFQISTTASTKYTFVGV